MLPRLIQTLFCSAVLLASAAQAAEHSASSASSVSFVASKDGAVVTSPFDVQFAVSGMEVRPAGDMAAGTGHHHLLIN